MKEIYIGLIVAFIGSLCGLIFFVSDNFLLLQVTHALFFAVMIFLVGLYRPRWTLLFLIGFLCVEVISIGVDGDIGLRPYQIIGGLLAVSVFLRIAMGRWSLSLPRTHSFDFVVGVLVALSFAHVLFSRDSADLKYAMVMTLCAVLYALTRVMVTKPVHVVRPAHFYVIAGVLVALYALVQNWLFLRGVDAGVVMDHRPQATFAEADWLGAYLVSVLGVIFASIIYVRERVQSLIYRVVPYCAMIVIMTGLIITVARSAWLGALCSTIVFLLCVFMGKKSFLDTVRETFYIGGAFLLAYVIIALSNLTTFDLGDRAASVGSGLQEITIACDPEFTCNDGSCSVPEEIAHVDVLTHFGCEHIDLEEVDSYTQKEFIVDRVSRPDPNIDIRKDVYAAALKAIKDRPFFGHGWSGSGKVLGEDPSGTALNTSNVVLEIALSMGIPAVVVFIISISVLVYRLLIHLPKRHIVSSGGLIGLCALIVPNMFNAGIFLGFVWVLIAMVVSLSERQRK